MKKLVILIISLILILIISHFLLKPDLNTNPFNITEEQQFLPKDSSFLVFMNPKHYGLFKDPDRVSDEVIDPKAFEEFVNSETAKIIEFAAKRGFKIDENDVFVGFFPGFRIKTISNSEELRLKKLWYREFLKKHVTAVQVDFRVQTIRARMQSDSVYTQTTRARMQEWDFNIGKKTSNGVIAVGGPRTDGNLKDSKVWVIDTGIDGDHQDLELSLSGTENLHKSYIKGDDNPLWDGAGHGTFIAGLIGAHSSKTPEDLTTGMNGVSRGAKLVSVKVLDSQGFGNFSDVINGLEYTLKRSRKGDIINMSLGFYSEEACKELGGLNQKRWNKTLRKKGVYLVMSAGNILQGDENASGPFSEFNCLGCINGSNIFTVGSISGNYSNGQIEFSEFSFQGSPSIDYLTPGNRIFSTYKDQGYCWMSGTSASAAIMSGILHATDGDFGISTNLPVNHTNAGSSYSVTYSIPKIRD